MRKVVQHFVKVCKHKHYVRQYCWKLGLYKQGILHDISKFSPIEFWESVKYYQGDRSPIDACKEENRYSNAWLHHKGRNKHHYEYYIDNLDKGGTAIQIPFLDSVELICDCLGAGKAYMKNNFSYEKEYIWWLNKIKKPLLMHSQTKLFITIVLDELSSKSTNTNKILQKDNLYKIY